MHRSSFNLQSYVRRVGEQVFPPPFAIDGLDMLVFVVATDRAEVNALLDRELNEPWQEAFALRGLRHHYKAATDWIMVVLSEADEVYPAESASVREAKANYDAAAIGHAGDAQAGNANGAPPDISAHQRELLVMVPIVDFGADPDAAQALSRDGGLCYVPLVLNDLPPAVAAGREVFGYPKVYARFDSNTNDRPLLEQSGPPWETLRIRAHGPVERSEDEKAAFIAAKKKRPSDFKLDLVDVLEINLDHQTRAHKPDIDERFAREASALFDQQIEMLFLRQFLDPQFPGKASYQAVVSGKVTAGPGDSSSGPPPPDHSPERFSLKFPKNALGGPSMANALGIWTDSDGVTVTPRAVFSLQDRNLLVPGGEIRWDKS